MWENRSCVDGGVEGKEDSYWRGCKDGRNVGRWRRLKVDLMR